MAIFNKIFKRDKATPPASEPPAERQPPKAPPKKPGAKPSGKKSPAAEPPPPPVDPMTPEERCEITEKMSKDEIREQLKKLFRRHNRLASSMDLDSRQEAEYMLDIIVQMREKYLG